MKKILILTIIILTIYLFSCNSIEPPSGLTINLTFEDVSCTEAWITLSSNLKLPATIDFKQNDQVVRTINLNKSDSLLYVDSLLPNNSYTFQASNNAYRVTSNQLQLTTLDTTSHNFTWETWEFGEHSSSVLYDVAIINENSIYAVGEIYLNDTLGQSDPNAYNLAKWNGNEWTLHRIMFYTICGQQSRTPYPASSIFAFSQNDIWVAMRGDQIAKIENGIQTQTVCLPLSFTINKIWGTSSNDLYVVGNNGNIAWYNGNQWTQIESGTNLDIYDIWGDYNETDNEYEIIAVAAKIGVNFEKKILRINKTTGVTSLSTNGIPYSLHGIWFKKKNCFVAGSGMYKKYDVNSSANWVALHQGITNYYLDAIRGNNLNDIIACGAFGELLHFNGLSWKSYIDITFINGAISGNIKGSVVCCYGLKDSQAIVIIGRR